MQTPPEFTIALRGYDRQQVEVLVQRASEAIGSSDPRLREATREALVEPTLLVRMRGYDRQQVDDYLGRVAQLLA
jgi:cell division septum initiation protein DivIVA